MMEAEDGSKGRGILGARGVRMEEPTEIVDYSSRKLVTRPAIREPVWA